MESAGGLSRLSQCRHRMRQAAGQAVRQVGGSWEMAVNRGREGDGPHEARGRGTDLA